MLQKPDICATCRFWSVTHSMPRKPYFETITGLGFCEPEGFPHLGVTFVAEASGFNEELDGKPLRPYAQAGSMHVRTLRSIGIQREQTQAFNVLACRPPNNRLDGESYEAEVIAHCAPIRNQRMAAARKFAEGNPNVKEHVFVALGDTAWSTLTGLAGKYRTISYARGYPIRTAGNGIVIGTWHPAHVRRNPKLMGSLAHDYRRAFDVALNGFNLFPTNYTLWPTDGQIRDLRDKIISLSEFEYLFHDIETPNVDNSRPIDKTNPGRIDSVQLSLAPGTGTYIDVNRDTYPVLAEIYASKCRKVGFNNWDFDDRVVDHFGWPLKGISDDVLWMHHHLQPDLVMEDAGAEADTDFRFSTSASLQSVASYYGHDFMWKHLRGATDQRDIRYYGVADVDSLARIMMLGFPKLNIKPLPEQLREMGLNYGR